MISASAVRPGSIKTALLLLAALPLVSASVPAAASRCTDAQYTETIFF